MLKDAILDKNRIYRYLLWRIWNKKLPNLGFVMLNPSTADETQDDQTIKKCIGFAQRMDYGGVYVANLFAYRATNPKELLKIRDPIGPKNNQYLSQFVEKVQKIIVAWGNPPNSILKRMIKERGIFLSKLYSECFCLGKTVQEQPYHPSRVGYDVKLKPFDLKR